MGEEGSTPGRSEAREADDVSQLFAGQVPCRWRSRSSEGLANSLGYLADEEGFELKVKRSGLLCEC